MELEEFEKKVIGYLNFINKSVTFNEIIDNIGLSRKKKKIYQEYLKQLEEDGKLVKLKGNRYTTLEKSGYVSGVLEIVQNSFAFIESKEESFYVSKSDIGNAFSGDVVLAKIIDNGDGIKKREAAVVKVLKRSRGRVAGIFKNNMSFGFVIPIESFGKDIYVPYKYFNGAKDGEMVVVEVYDWGNDEKKPEGKIIEKIGNINDSNNLIKALIKMNGLSEEFPKEVIREADKISEYIPEEEIKQRVDLRKYNIITIDGDDAKDFDDAVYVEKMRNGNFRLIVSIADVSYFIKEGSELDKEAYKRGNSVYLVDRVLPMFPEKLSNGVCSLNEKVDRLTFSVEIIYNMEGKAISTEFYKSIINSKHRMTYNNVNKIFNGDINLIEKYKDIYEMLKDMRTLSEIIRNVRVRRGSIDFDISEKKVVLDENGKVKFVTKRERGIAEKLIEDFMIAANEAVAEKLFWANFPTVYRVHEKPDIEKMKFLNEFLGKFGYKIHKIDDVHPSKLQKIIEDIKDKEYGMLLNKMILMSLKQARYSIENLGHFGLASSCYTHFTSPIRRYADLLVHRSLYDLISYKKIKKINLEKFLEVAADNISRTERKAMEVEEESVKIKIVEYMKEYLGEVYDCVVIGYNKYNMYVETEDNIEVTVQISDLKGDYFFDEKSYKILEKKSNKEYNIGSRLKIQISRVDIRKLNIEGVPYVEKTQKGE